MAAVLAVIRQNKRHETAMHNFEKQDDPYGLISKFPPEQDRILDVVVEKLMLDGYKFRKFHSLPLSLCCIFCSIIYAILNR